jgi:hypothetical protein
MSQATLTTYGGRLHDIGYEGQVADLSSADYLNLMNAQAAQILFGRVVVRDAGGQVRAPSADNQVIIGIAARHSIHPSPGFGQTNAFAVGYNQYDEVPVLKKGDIFVMAAENVTVDDQALSITAGAGTIGGVTGGAAGAGRVVIPGAHWLDTTAAGSIGRVRIVS